jgi:hypothetical protein
MVEVGSLGELTVLGSGGQGTVYAVSADTVYKQYTPDVRRELDPDVLTGLVQFHRDLDEQARRRLDAVTAWPTDVVQRDGVVSGFLMPRAPSAFSVGLRVSRGPVQRLAQMQLLLNDDAYLTGRGLLVDDRFRLDLLHDVAEAMEFLHGLGVVVGDLSPNNLLFSRSHRPRCFFLDCDAMWLRGRSVLRSAETVDWQAPPGERGQPSAATDSYKFGLLMLRLFAGDQSTRDATAVERAGPAVRVLALRSMSHDSRWRPSMAEWRQGLGPPRRPARPIAVAVATVLLVVLVLGLLPRCSARVRDRGDGDGRAAGQANAVAQVIALSGGARQRSADAVRAIAACRGARPARADLRDGAAVRGAAAERAQALDTDQLPQGAELRYQLVEALAHFRLADIAYADWASAVERSRCALADLLGPDRARGDDEAAAATAATRRFVVLWNPLAAEYGHETVSDQDL